MRAAALAAAKSEKAAGADTAKRAKSARQAAAAAKLVANGRKRAGRAKATARAAFAKADAPAAVSAQAPAQADANRAAAYLIMTYKTASAVACRERGGRQMFQVALRGNISEARRIAEEGRDRLVAGSSLADLKTWALVEKAAAIASVSAVAAAPAGALSQE